MIARAYPVAAAALLGAACASAPASEATEPVEGCWYFAGAADGALPWGVELTSTPLTTATALPEDTRRAVTLTGTSREDHPFGYWRVLAAGDSVELGYPGMGGMVLRLAVGPDRRALSGTARPVGDALPFPAGGQDRETSTVRLAKAQCPGAEAAPR